MFLDTNCVIELKPPEICTQGQVLDLGPIPAKIHNEFDNISFLIVASNLMYALEIKVLETEGEWDDGIEIGSYTIQSRSDYADSRAILINVPHSQKGIRLNVEIPHQKGNDETPYTDPIIGLTAIASGCRSNPCPIAYHDYMLQIETIKPKKKVVKHARKSR